MMMMMMIAITSGMSHLWLRRTKRKLPVCTVSCFHFPLCCQRHISQSGRQSGNVALTTPQLKSEIATMGIPFQHAAKQKSIKSTDFWQLPAHCNCSYEWKQDIHKNLQKCIYWVLCQHLWLRLYSPSPLRHRICLRFQSVWRCHVMLCTRFQLWLQNVYSSSHGKEDSPLTT